MEFVKWRAVIKIPVEIDASTEEEFTQIMKSLKDNMPSTVHVTGDIHRSYQGFCPVDTDGRHYERAYQTGVGTVWYLPSCPHGYRDCISDPEYIKAHYPDWYAELVEDNGGKPLTSCTHCEDGEYYDDEDK